MQQLIVSTGLSFLLLVGIDGVWLGLIAKSFYQKHIGHLMADTVQWWAAGVFYPLYAFGMAYFVIVPGLQSNAPILSVALRGGLLGLIAYAAYDFTNQATLKNWPVIMTIADLAWGTFVTAVVSALTVFLLRQFA